MPRAYELHFVSTSSQFVSTSSQEGQTKMNCSLVGGARANRGEVHVTDFGRQRPQHDSVEARKGNGDIGALGNMELRNG